jgi:hypothetical protein
MALHPERLFETAMYDQKALKFLRDILPLGSMIVTPGETIDAQIGNERVQILVEGRKIILPEERYNSLSTAEREQFHVFLPLQESSAVVAVSKSTEKWIRNCVVTINLKTIALIGDLLLIAHSRYVNDAPIQFAPLLVALNECDPNKSKVKKGKEGEIETISHSWIDKWGQLSRKFTDSQWTAANSLVWGFSKRNARVDNVSYLRAFVTTFPLYEELVLAETREKKEVYGITIPSALRRTIRQIFEVLFPNLNKEGEYLFRTNSHHAPVLIACLQAMHKLYSKINELIESDFYQNTMRALGEDPVEPMSMEWTTWYSNIEQNLADISSKMGVSVVSASQSAQARSIPVPEVSVPVIVPPLQQQAQITPPSLPMNPTQPVTTPGVRRIATIDGGWREIQEIRPVTPGIAIGVQDQGPANLGSSLLVKRAEQAQVQAVMPGVDWTDLTETFMLPLNARQVIQVPIEQAVALMQQGSTVFNRMGLPIEIAQGRIGLIFRVRPDALKVYQERMAAAQQQQNLFPAPASGYGGGGGFGAANPVVASNPFAFASANQVGMMPQRTLINNLPHY